LIGGGAGEEVAGPGSETAGESRSSRKEARTGWVLLLACYVVWTGKDGGRRRRERAVSERELARRGAEAEGERQSRCSLPRGE